MKHNPFKNILAMPLVVALLHLPVDMNAQEISLPAPAKTGGISFAEAVANRHSTREFDPARDVSDAAVGQILWSAVGINRENATPPAPGKAPADRCNPTALNSQEITAYLFNREGVYEYLPENHRLRLVKAGDHRSLVSGTKEFSQEFVLSAPCSIVFVADLSRLPAGDASARLAAIDAGIACENLTLACSALGLATVPRATMDSAAISELLGLSPGCIPLLNNPVGHPAR